MGHGTDPQVIALPWLLTHGDLVPLNMMVDPTSNRLTRLVDWAGTEVEVLLPFALCLYGLEKRLGFTTSTEWTYCNRSECFRADFWPDLGGVLQALDAPETARDIGELLWHGFAWDDGAIHRVVKDGHDDEEVCRLDAFLEYGSRSGNIRALNRDLSKN